MRMLPWLLLLLLVIYMLRKKIRQAGDGTASSRRQAEPDAEAMVRCDECGVHLPVSEALPGPGGRVFCSQEHRVRNASS